jgi:hypothetical protein
MVLTCKIPRDIFHPIFPNQRQRLPLFSAKTPTKNPYETLWKILTKIFESLAEQDIS